MDLTELCNLSNVFYAAAIMVIRGRKELMCEPHSVIDNGDIIFSELWSHWEHLHVCNAWKAACVECGGSGSEYDDNGEKVGDCSYCNGRGYEDPVEDLT